MACVCVFFDTKAILLRHSIGQKIQQNFVLLVDSLLWAYTANSEGFVSIDFLSLLSLALIRSSHCGSLLFERARLEFIRDAKFVYRNGRI